MGLSKTPIGLALAAITTPLVANPEAAVVERENSSHRVTVSNRPATPAIGTAKLAEPPSGVPIGSCSFLAESKGRTQIARPCENLHRI